MDTNDIIESSADRLREIMRGFVPLPNKLAERPKPAPVVTPTALEPAQQVAVRVGGSDTKFKPGNCAAAGAGRPRGSKNKLKQKLLDNVDGVLDAMVAQALAGDTAAATLVVNRVLPTLRPQSELVQFTLDADQSISKQVEQVLTAISKGEVAPDVGKKIIEVVQSLANVRAVEDLSKRIETLEAMR